MNWNEFLQWSRIGFIACCALVVQLALSLAAGMESRELKLQRSIERSDQTHVSVPAVNPPPERQPEMKLQ